MADQTGDDNDNTLIGSNDGERLNGLGGDDILWGNGGNDVLIGGSGDDSMHGGTGNDEFQVNGTGNGYDWYAGDDGTVDIIKSTEYFSQIGIWKIDGIEFIDGNTAFISLLNSDTSYIFDFSGINISGVAQIQISNDFGTTVYGSDQFDKILGGDYDDTIEGNGGDDVLYGYGGADTIGGGAGDDELRGGYGVGGGTDASNDTLFGDAGNDSLYGDDGDDFLEGGADGDTLDGGNGNDTASYYYSSDANSDGFGVTVTVNGSTSGDDATGDTLSNIENLIGSAFKDTLTGDSGDNAIMGGAGADTLNGGAGADWVSYLSSNAGVTLDLSLSIAQTSTGDASGDILSNFENIEGSDYNDTLTGDSDDNDILGGAGDDVLEGGDGGDTLDGGTGTDTAAYAGSSAAVSINLSADYANYGDATGDTLTDLENITGSDFADSIQGDSAANVLKGGLGVDSLTGHGGDDTLEGGAGADTLNGGAGNDTATYAGSSAAVSINLNASYANYGDATGDTLTDIENVTGSDFADSIQGDSADNVLEGGLGVDSLTGHGGDDILEGGAGADTLNGGAGTDTATYTGSSAAVSIHLGSSYANYGDATGDTLTGIENVTGSDFADSLQGDNNDNVLIGGLGDDYLSGHGGDDTLEGGADDDTLESGTGNDTMVGGTGDDLFVFYDNFGTDTITDFTAGTGVADVIDLSALGITDSDSDGDVDIDDLTITDVSGNAVIDLGADGTITLTGVSSSSLVNDDFIF